MSQYKPYPAYKDSGVEWLGKVPENWVISQMKSGLTSIQNGVWGAEPDGGLDDVPCARVADFDRVGLVVNDFLPTVRKIPLHERTYKQVSQGDLLLEKSGGGEKTTVGAMVQYCGKQNIVCSNFVAVIKCKSDVHARWMCYVNSHLYSIGVNTRSIKQTTGIQNLDSNQYTSEAIVFPTYIEQKNIAHYLDRETTRIDALITKKTRFIQLLREKRQALITHAVTKGLDPNVKMKDSGVEWLGEVPEHWDIVPLKYEAEFVNGAAFKPEQWSEEGTPIIRIENLNGSLNFNHFEGEIDSRYYVQKGDLLFGWSGNRGTSFGPFIWPHEGPHYLNQHIFRICDFTFEKAWFYWTLKAVTSHVEDQAHGIIGMVHITKGDLGAIKIATPELVEQKAIAAYLDRETTRLDTLIAKTTRSIELLKERRSALITAAVTGQINLCEAE